METEMLRLPARSALLLSVLFIVTSLQRTPCTEVAAATAFAITQIDLPADKLRAIEQAAPDQAPAKPAKTRKVLVYGRVPTHPKSVPFCFNAFEILGKKTGAFGNGLHG